MTAIDARDLTLSIGDGGDPEQFNEIGGLRTHRLSLRNSPARYHDVSLPDGWEKTLPNSGRQQMSLTGQGIFTDSASEELLRSSAFGNSIHNFQIALGNGDTLSGPFSILRYERSADMESAVEYQISLQSAGRVEFVGAI